jgi:hypothetical protein
MNSPSFLLAERLGFILFKNKIIELKTQVPEFLFFFKEKKEFFLSSLFVLFPLISKYKKPSKVTKAIIQMFINYRI